ncbi:MAG: DUF3109 family protein [Bacteroidota bacterium]
MIQIDNTLLSEELFEKQFVCDLSACKGACCVEGDAGAPLDEEEIHILEDIQNKIKPFLRKEGVEAIEKQGAWEMDRDGEYVTPLVNGKECAYVQFAEDGTTLCAIVKAWLTPLLEPCITSAAESGHQQNFKSVLQQHVQREFQCTPDYRVLAQQGPDHAKTFTIAVQIGEQGYEPAEGASKKQAEQRAALNALDALDMVEHVGDGVIRIVRQRDEANAIEGH